MKTSSIIHYLLFLLGHTELFPAGTLGPAGNSRRNLLSQLDHLSWLLSKWRSRSSTLSGFFALSLRLISLTGASWSPVYSMSVCGFTVNNFSRGDCDPVWGCALLIPPESESLQISTGEASASATECGCSEQLEGDEVHLSKLCDCSSILIRFFSEAPQGQNKGSEVILPSTK